jgi:hypothetical protein
MTDRVLAAFLDRQRTEGLALAASSDLVDVLPLEPEPPQRYLVRFGCTGLVGSETNEVEEAAGAVVGIWFADDYLRHVDPMTVLTWLEPRRVFHPNVRAPFVCLGRIVPGTPLVDLIYRCFELITWRRVTMREDDALNREACAWARRNTPRFPIDRRPLRRQAAGAFDLELVEVS